MSASAAIPKFASFKPKAAAEGIRKEDTIVEKGPTTSRSDHKGRHHHHRRHRSKSKERLDRHTVEARADVATKVVDNNTDWFIEDRIGDTQNLIYGSIHRYSIPAFHRVGAGNVLGAQRELKIDRQFLEEKGIILSDRREDSRNDRVKYIFARNEKKASRLLKVRPNLSDGTSTANNVDFIPLRSSRTQKPESMEYDIGHSSDEENQNYRSIEGKMKLGAEPLDDELEWASDYSDPETGRAIRFDEIIKNQNIELSRKVNENPLDVEAWIALINHQDSLLGWADEGRRKYTSAEKRSTADIKVHMYEKALEKAGNTLLNRERLLLGLMAEGSKIWDFKTRAQRWEQISKDNFNSIILWKQYLDFRQCSFGEFRHEEIRAIHTKRIEFLNERIAKDAEKTLENDELYEHLIYIILRATIFLRESGYSELSIAIWQALLEFNFFDTNALVSSGSRISSFQEFWESEVPRIGEEGAKGWLNFSHDEDPPEGTVDIDVPSENLGSDDLFNGWATAEKLKAAASRLPARTMDDTTEDDPYRLILWSDINDYMIDLSSSSCRAKSSRLLLDAFLTFCRLPPIHASDDLVSRQWWNECFMRGELIDCSRTWITSQFLELPISELSAELLSIEDPKEDEKSVNDSNFFDWPFQIIAGSPDTLFATANWANYFVPWQSLSASTSQTSVASGGSKLYNWIRNSLKNILQTKRFENFGEYYLAFEFCNEPGDIKKISKNLLKQNPQSLNLYNVYANIELSRGNKEVSENVMTAALGMRSSLPEAEQKNSILLWKTWVWALLDDRNHVGALKCLFSIADGTPAEMESVDLSSAAFLLKTKQHMGSSRDYLLSSGDLRHAIMYAECLALVEYLTSQTGKETSSQNQGDIASALMVFEKTSSALTARNQGASIFHEILLQSAARLLYYHTQSGPFRPALLRTHLSKSLSIFPKNTIFLTLYTWNESRLRIDDRVRSLLRSVILTEANDSLISRLFGIRYEIRVGNIHSAHAAFENAVSSPACGSNPGLWRLYVLFCAGSKELQDKVKVTFYRGMRVCPWAKDYIVMAFTEIRSYMSSEELVSIYRVMGEKELRIRVDIEDRLEELRDTMASA